ncbi:L,D-transpeptidase [bacterium]|nr:L,D-transpeptidase [bacterium]
MSACQSVSQECYPPVSGIPEDKWIQVTVSKQTLSLMYGDSLIKEYGVSTSKFGVGNLKDSYQTPLGWHRIHNKIGQGEPVGTIFKSRKPTGRKAIIRTDSVDLPEDLITTRILRLEGCEPGLNQGDDKDSYNRFIYIHGTHEEGLIGQPASHGCIRMKNMDILELFDQVKRRTLVQIIE